MGDPFSAAGTAVGIVSLGLQVCQGLISYYDKWKSFDEDIIRIHGKLDGLRKTLENLEKEHLPKLKDSNTKAVDDVNEKILSCDDSIRKLKAVLEKCHSSHLANSVQGKTYKLFQRFCYPFKKDTLHELNVSVTSLQENLHSSLLSLLLGVTGDQREDLSILISNSQAEKEEFKYVRREIQSTTLNVEAIRDGIETIQQQADDLQVTSSSIKSTLETKLENLPKLNEGIEMLPERLEKLLMINFENHWQKTSEFMINSQLSGFQRNAAIQNGAHSIQARLLEKPSLLRTVCDETNRTENAIHISSLSRRQLKCRNCSCRSSTSSLEFRGSRQSQPLESIWGAKLSSSALVHRKDCALFKYPERENSWNLRVVYCGRLIAQAVTASIHLKRGAGGFSISPSLNCSLVVSSTSPAFALITEYVLEQGNDVILRRIIQLFQDGKALARDVDEDGNSLIHRAISDGRSYGQDIILVIEFLLRLGIPLNEVNAEGLTCLDEVQRWRLWHDSEYTLNLSSRMLDFGAEFIGVHKLNRVFTLNFVNSALKFEELVEASNFNDICKAVLLRSESELLEVLRSCCHLINEPNILGLRPLHLSIGWPSGIKILLDHEADVNVIDCYRYRPVDHAIIRGCLNSLKNIEEANYPLRGLERALNEGLGNEYDRAKAGIFDYLIKMEVNRRRNLQSLVSSYLPKSLIYQLSPSDGRLFDAYAQDAVNALQEHGISIPTSLEYKYRETVYHLPNLTSKILDSLWEAGFRDINSPDWCGNTPLMSLGKTYDLGAFLEVVHWFENKGVDIDEKVEHIHRNADFSHGHRNFQLYSSSGHTVLHLLAFRLGVEGGYSSRLMKKLPLILSQRIITNKTRDACECACSSGGCCAINIFFKGWLSMSSNEEIHFSEKFDQRIRPLLNWLVRITTDVTSKTMFFDIIRFLTFLALDLTHTCCRGKHYDLIPFENEDEIHEIHDEEREDLQLLEDLLLEFGQQWRESNCSIKEFFFGYWRARMTEVLSEETSDNLRATGAFLDSSDDGSRVTEVLDYPDEDGEDDEDDKDDERDKDPENPEEDKGDENPEEDENAGEEEILKDEDLEDSEDLLD